MISRYEARSKQWVEGRMSSLEGGKCCQLYWQLSYTWTLLSFLIFILENSKLHRESYGIRDLPCKSAFFQKDGFQSFFFHFS